MSHSVEKLKGAVSNGLQVRHTRRNASCWSRLFVIVFAFLLFGITASAQTTVYTIRGTTGGNNNIWAVNLATGVERLVYAGYPGGNAASLAQRPSDGMLFYAINGTNGAVYRFNPATPNVAPATIGNLGPTLAGLDVSGGFRMAFSGNTLYYMIGNSGADANTVYTVDQGIGRANPLATVSNTNNGGDIAFLGNTLYAIDQDLRLCSYAGLPASGAAGSCNTIGVSGANSIGIAFSSGGQLLLHAINQTAGTSNLYSVTIPGLAVSNIASLSGGGSATGDLAGANVPAPDLSITKTDGVTNVYRGGPVGYTIVVTNNGTYPVTGTVVDNLPATVTGATWTCAATLPSFCGAASGSGNINTTVTLQPAASATFTISNGTLSSSASGTLVNTATVAVPLWLTDSAPANNTATDTDTINLNANLGITKTDGLTNITPGGPITYTIVVSNAGPDASNGSIVTDTVPAAITGVTWTCGNLVGGATCGAASGSGNTINTTANLPSGGSVTYTVSGTLPPTPPGTLSNTARVITPASGVTDPNDPTRTGANNNSATDTTTINGVSDVRIAKSHSGNFTVGVNGTYTLTASNAGTLATSGTITVTDNLPTGLTVAAIPAPAGWNCSTTVVGSSTMTCTSSTVIPAGANHPNSISLSVVVSPAAFAASPVTNVANISGGSEPAYNNGNNSASDPTTINGVSDVRIAKSHSGNFTVGVNGTYTLTASNAGTLATSGTITVTDNLPTGLTVAAIPAPAGWNCSTTVVGSSTMTCTSSTVIAAGANHPNSISLSVVVSPAAFAASPVTNVANISGGSEPAYNNGNNSASDPTTINGVSDVRIAKSHSGNFTVGVNGTYTLTASNAGTLATSGTITVTDNLPTGLTVAAIPAPAGWNCSTTVVGSSTMTCTSSTVIAAGANHPNSISLSVVVSPAAFAASPVTNVANISGGSEPAYNNGNNSASDPTIINGAPDLTISKTHTGNFTQGQFGAIYSIIVTNSGTASTNGSTITVSDTLPVGLAATSISGSGWSCVLGTLTCTRNDSLAAGISYSTITLTVDVALTAPGSVVNSASVSGGGETNVSNNSANDPTTINPAAPPNLALVKSVSPSGAQVPGTDLTYTIVYTNSGGQPATNFVIIDPNMLNADPLERVLRNLDFKIGSMTSVPGTTGLVATFEYSNDGGATWTYAPSSGGGGAPAGYDRNVTNVRWVFAGSLSHTAPNNTGSVDFVVRIR